MGESFIGGVNKDRIRKTLLVLIGVSLCVNLISLIGYSLRDWDEGVFALQGQWLTGRFTQGKPYNFQTPPLYPLIAGLGMRMTGGNPIILPILAALLSVATLFLLFYSARELYGPVDAVYAVALFATTEMFFFFSKSGLSDALFLFLFCGAFFNIVRNKNDRVKYYLLSSMFIVLAIYTKYSGIILVSYALTAGILTGAYKKWKWLLCQIILPVIACVPLVILYLKFAGGADTGRRFAELIGINYHKYLYYLMVFAPAPLLLALFSLFRPNDRNMSNKMLIVAVVVYAVLLGLYFPYIRLAYPLVALIAISGAGINIPPVFKGNIVLVAAIAGVAFSVPTIVYNNRVPARYAAEVCRYKKQEDIEYLYSNTPPNIEYYLPGEFAVPENHAWAQMISRYPGFSGGHKIIRRSKNELPTGNRILIAHASINDSLKSILPDIYSHSQLVFSLRFIDAPLYRKDIFNRYREQRYELYRVGAVERATADSVWQMGFRKGISLLID